MNICARVTVLLLLTGVGRAVEQRFAETPSAYQEVSSGDDVQLTCRVQDKRGQCIWQKDRKPVGMHPDKYEWSGRREGDCSLMIRRASLDFDDGFWECQVTPGDFTRQDALTSLPAHLLVRVQPRKPRLEYGGVVLSSALTLKEGQEATLSCVSRYGNPPALIKWFIGGDEVAPLRNQTNATEVDNPKTWAAHSLLWIRGERRNHGLPIKCLTLHPSNPQPGKAESRLDILYTPEVKLETVPRVLATALEDSASFVSLKCLSDANPPAAIKWFKDSAPMTGVNNIVSLNNNRTSMNETITGAEVRFEPVQKEHAGLYSCRASNSIGESPPANYRLDVQFGPRVMIKGDKNRADVAREEEVTVLLGASLEPFKCDEFEANPTPHYRWVHLRGGTSTEMIENPARDKDSGRQLRLENVIWSDEGEYRCVAFNLINGVRREMSSDARYVLHVTGPPEIQTRPSADEKGVYESIGWVGEPVHRLRSLFCSRPPPSLVTWQWGSSHIRAGESIQPKYEALPLEPIIENKMVSNCYWAKLEIKNLQKEDARIYTLMVESEKGRDSTSLKLIIRDPTELRVIAAAAAVGAVFLILLISIGLYWLLKARRREYTQEEEDGSIAADAFYSSAASVDRQRHFDASQNKNLATKPSQGGGLAIMYDYDQITKQGCAMSPEALKVRRAPAVLQAPTIV